MPAPPERPLPQQLPQSCTMIRGNLVHDNDDANVPAYGISRSSLVGAGIEIPGGMFDIVTGIGSSAGQPVMPDGHSAVGVTFYGAQRRAGYCTSCWKVGRFTHGIPDTCSAPVGWNWMSSRAGLH